MQIEQRSSGLDIQATSLPPQASFFHGAGSGRIVHCPLPARSGSLQARAHLVAGPGNWNTEVSLKNEPCCAVCGHRVEPPATAYLLSISPHTHGLRVQHWDRELAKAAGVRIACKSTHAVEIAALWMATGTLQFTFAQSGREPRLQKTHCGQPTSVLPYFARGRPSSNLIGEVAVNPWIATNPSAANVGLWVTILDSLQEAMESTPKRPPMAMAFPHPPNLERCG